MEERETLANMRLAAQMTRNSAPPHCHPITILILTLAIGTIFIGMTMTIVANWPGSVSYGFDPLSIPGPIILVLGGLMFIIGSGLVCYFQMVERKKKGQKFVSFATTLSRANLEMSSHHHSKQHLEKEYLTKKRRKSHIEDEDDEDVFDETDPSHVLRGKKIQGQHVLDEVITTTSTTGTALELTGTYDQSGDEHLPLPVRSSKKTKNKNNSSKVTKSLEKMTEEEEEEDEDGKSKERMKKKKKKKINANYSRDVFLENKKSSPQGDHHQDDQDHHHQDQEHYQQQQHESNHGDDDRRGGDDDDRGGDDDDDPSHSLRIHVSTKPGTAVTIRHATPASEVAPLLHEPPIGRKKKSKKVNQS